MNARRIHSGVVPALFAATIALVGRSVLAQSATAVAAEIGITPKSVVIANLDGAVTSLVVSRIQGATALREELAAGHQAVDAAAAVVTVLSQALHNDAGDNELMQQHQEAVAASNAAKLQVTAVRNALFEDAIAGLPPEQVAMITTCKEGARYRVQPEFRAKHRTGDEWRAIERALRAERRAIRLGEDLDEVQADLLAGVRGDVVVIEALQHLEMNLEWIQQVFQQFDQ